MNWQGPDDVFARGATAEEVFLAYARQTYGIDRPIVDYWNLAGGGREDFLKDLPERTNGSVLRRYAYLDALETSQTERILDRTIHAYSPAGHSAWAGDVINFWHDSVYHLFFLYDHHHHGNRWGGGVHYFYHMTTEDFVNWTDHGPCIEIEEPWQAFGTGTPFFYNG